MGIQKITFEGGNVTSKIDADIYHHIFSGENGILKHIKDECRYTLANNTITFSDGYISIYGRIIFIEKLTTIGVTPDSSKSGYVVLGVNTQTNEARLYLKEQTGGYPNLTQNNLLTGEGVYEFPLCAYTKTTTSVSLQSYFVRDYISSNKVRIDDLKDNLYDKYLPKTRGVSKVSSGVYELNDTSSYELMQSIVYVVLSNNTIISFPGDVLFIGVGSNKTVSYRYGNADYSLGLNYREGKLVFTCGSTSHVITRLYFKK